MKRIILLTILCLVYCLSAPAQIITDYYKNRTTVTTGTGISYRVDSSWPGSYIIENENNVRTGQPMRFLTGELVPPPHDIYDAKRVGDFHAIAKEIFEAVFTPVEIEIMILHDLYFSVELIIVENGKVIEMRFVFSDKPGLVSISPNKFRMIEVMIKERMMFEVSPTGKTVQWIVAFQYWNPKPLFKK